MQRRYDRIPKVFVVKEGRSIDIHFRIDTKVTGRQIKEQASKFLEVGTLLFMSGRELTDDEEVKGTSHVVFTFAPKKPISSYVASERHAQSQYRPWRSL